MVLACFILTIVYKFCLKMNMVLLKRSPNGLGLINVHLNEWKTKLTVFHKPRDNDNLQLQLTNLEISNYKIKQSSSIKFIIVLVDKKPYFSQVAIVENKSIIRNLGIAWKLQYRHMDHIFGIKTWIIILKLLHLPLYSKNLQK